MNPEQIKNLQEMARQVFRQADSDRSGSIEKQELASLINKLSNQLGIESIDEEEIDEVFEEFDENGDGVLQLDEFQNFVVQLFQISQSELHKCQPQIKKGNKEKKPKEKKSNQSFTSSDSSEEEQDKVDGLENEKIENKFFQKIKKGQVKKYDEMNKKTRQLTRQSIMLINKQKELEEQIFKALNPNLTVSKEEWEKQQKARSFQRTKSILLLQQQFERDSLKISQQKSQIYRTKSVSTVCTYILPKKDDHTVNMKELIEQKNFLPQINPNSNSVQINGQKNQNASIKSPTNQMSNLNLQSLDQSYNNDTTEFRLPTKAQTTSNQQYQKNQTGRFFKTNQNESFKHLSGGKKNSFTRSFQPNPNNGILKSPSTLPNLYSQARKSVEVFHYQPHYSKGYSTTKNQHKPKKEAVFYIIRDKKQSSSSANNDNIVDNQENNFQESAEQFRYSKVF